MGLLLPETVMNIPSLPRYLSSERASRQAQGNEGARSYGRLRGRQNTLREREEITTTCTVPTADPPWLSLMA